jgi:hypothetical protein
MNTLPLLLRAIAAAVAIVIVLSFLALSHDSASAAGAAKKRVGMKPNRFRVVLLAPEDAKHRPIQEHLTKRGMPQRLSQFLSPLRLPRDVIVTVQGCQGDVNAYYDDGTITICYEFLQYFVDRAPKETTPEGLTQEDAFLAPGITFILHEVGHAVFDLLEIPVLGREEDAADLLSAYLQLQLGPESARKLIVAIAYLGDKEIQVAMSKGVELADFSDVHGLPAQRYFNVLCMAYGFDRKLFADAVTRWHLPRERAESCEAEYQTFERAYRRLIAPYIDPQLLKAVKARDWLRFDANR